jgi:hypothetical protein
MCLFPGEAERLDGGVPGILSPDGIVASGGTSRTPATIARSAAGAAAIEGLLPAPRLVDMVEPSKGATLLPAMDAVMS